MPVNAVGAGNSINQSDFIQLMVKQLQFQDPLNPVDDSQFLTQLTQFNTLDVLNNLNANFQSMLTLNQLTSASALIGKTVQATLAASQQHITGTVSSVVLISGIPKLVVNGTNVDLSEVTNVN